MSAAAEKGTGAAEAWVQGTSFAWILAGMLYRVLHS